MHSDADNHRDDRWDNLDWGDLAEAPLPPRGSTAVMDTVPFSATVLAKLNLLHHSRSWTRQGYVNGAIDAAYGFNEPTIGMPNDPAAAAEWLHAYRLGQDAQRNG